MDATSLNDDLRILRGLAGISDHRKSKKLRAEEAALMKAAVSIVFDDDELEAIEAQRARPGKGSKTLPLTTVDSRQRWARCVIRGLC